MPVATHPWHTSSSPSLTVAALCCCQSAQRMGVPLAPPLKQRVQTPLQLETLYRLQAAAMQMLVKVARQMMGMRAKHRLQHWLECATKQLQLSSHLRSVLPTAGQAPS